MQFIGYLNKKGSAKFYTDNILSPTFFSCSSNPRINKDLQEFKGMNPIFSLSFKLDKGMSIASGFEIFIKDKDIVSETFKYNRINGYYSLFNNKIVDLFTALQNGSEFISLEDGYFQAIFKLVKVGKSYGLELVTSDDMNNISDTFPEVTNG